MRFHTAVMLYVLAFSPFFTLTKTQYAVLILTISSVISAEMLNTAAEELADLSAADYNPLARAAKDIAAGAVLVCAFFSVVVGAVILWQPDAFARIFRFFLDKPWMLAVTLAATALIAVYVVDRKSLCPLGWKSKKEVTRCRNRQNRKARLSPL